MEKHIYIKQSDLILDSSPVNYRYSDRLNLFQDYLFKHSDLQDFYRSLIELKEKSGASPLGNKLDRVKEFLIAHLYLLYGFSISEICDLLNIRPTEVSWYLICFFSQRYDDIKKLNNFFQVNDFSSNRVEKRYSELSFIMQDSMSAEEVFNSVKKLQLSEILESPGWNRLGVKGKLPSLDIGQKSLTQLSMKTLFSFLFILSLMSVFLFLAIEINSYNESRLLSKVSIPSRFFTWLDTKDFNSVDLMTRGGSTDVDRALVPVRESRRLIQVEEDRFGVESDVVLTSLDQIETGEISSLTENRRGGFRDTRYGDRKVYRLMITSSDVIDLSDRMGEIIKKYNITKGGNVEAGSNLPGGLYYNLLVPTPSLKTFFSDLDKTENVTIYLSKSRMRAPEGKSNVFIWAKKI